jgi:hypothetical protein
VLGGLIAVAIPNALALAPYRAWRMLNPFRIKVVSGQLDSEYPKEAFPRQYAAVRIKNLSYRQRSNCVLHIWQIAGFDNQHHALPRFVYEFALLPGDTKEIGFLSWTTRSPPHENDSMFTLSGPTGPGYGGNVVKLPCGSYEIDIRISGCGWASGARAAAGGEAIARADLSGAAARVALCTGLATGKPCMIRKGNVVMVTVLSHYSVGLGWRFGRKSRRRSISFSTFSGLMRTKLSSPYVSPSCRMTTSSCGFL